MKNMIISNLTTYESFRKTVLRSSIPMLIYFWAEWCIPCRTLNSILKYFQEIETYKVNIDYNSLLAKDYNIKLVPTILLFYKSKVIYRLSGSISEKQMIMIKQKVLLRDLI